MLRPFADRLAEVRLMAGAPSYAALKRLDPFLPPSTVSDVLSGRTNPRVEFVLAFVRACRRYAQETRTPIPDLEMFDEQAWRKGWVRLQRELKGCRRRERAPTETAATSSHFPGARVLPPDIPAFTGRSAQLAVLDGLLDLSPAAGLVTTVVIDGLFGVGKTALAVHWAHSVQRYFDDVVFLDVGEIEKVSPVVDRALTALLAALGAVPDRTLEAAGLAAPYDARTAGRRTLLILDDVGDVDRACALAPSGAGSIVVMTSRWNPSVRPVRRPVRRLSLPPLSATEATTLLVRMLGRPDRHTPDEVERAAAACGRLPSALRTVALDAALLPHASLKSICDGVRAGGPRSGPAAGASVPAWCSFTALVAELPDAAQAALRRLGLHPTTEFDLQAAAALLDQPPGETGRRLDVLVSAHLLDRVTACRYRINELVAAYAARSCRLGEDEGTREAAVRRLLHWYLRTAEAAGELLVSAPQHSSVVSSGQPCQLRDHGDAARWCELERANLMAVAWLAAAVGDHVTAWRLPVVVAPYFTERHPRDWVEVYRSAAVCALAAGGPADRGYALSCLGAAYRAMRWHDQALQCFEDALRHFRTAGDLTGQAHTLVDLGTTAGRQGRHRVAFTWYRRGHEVALRAGRDDLIGVSLRHLAETALELGLDDLALEHGEGSLAVSRRLADDLGCGRSFVALGRVYGRLGLHLKAIETFHLAIAAMERAGDLRGAADALECLSQLLQSLGHAGNG